MLVIGVNRDSVHAGDDLESHRISITLEPAATVRTLIETIQRIGYLPVVSGAEATWIIYLSGKQIGVLAQQWVEPKLVIPAGTILTQYSGYTNPNLLFRYWCQADPDSVFCHINAGKEPPSRFQHW